MWYLFGCRVDRGATGATTLDSAPVDVQELATFEGNLPLEAKSMASELSDFCSTYNRI